MTEFSVCTPPGNSSREQLDRGGDFFEGPESHMQKKNEGNENKIIHGDVNCTMDKIDRDGEN